MKINILYCIVLAAGLTGCSGNTKTIASDGSVDTMLTESTEDASGIANSGTESQPVIISDALCLDVRGKISKLEETVKNGLYEGITVYEFDDNGHLTKSYMKDSGVTNDDMKVSRNPQGIPTKLTMKVEDEMGDEQEYTISFAYDDQLRLVREQHENYDSSWTTEYNRDKDGKVTSMTVKDSFGGSEKSTFTYPEGSIDEKGNWTKRTADSGTDKTTVTRKIVYK